MLALAETRFNRILLGQHSERNSSAIEETRTRAPPPLGRRTTIPVEQKWLQIVGLLVLLLVLCFLNDCIFLTILFFKPTIS